VCLNSNDNFVQISDIKVITKTTTEEIHKRYINDFLITLLEENDILISSNTFVRYNFLKNINLYEVYVVQHDTPDFTIAPDILSAFYDKNKINTTDLFVLEDFFAVFQDKQLLCFRKRNNDDIEDIKIYVTQAYKTNINTTYSITNISFEQLKETFQNKNKTKQLNNFKKLYSTNYFAIFGLYSFVGITIFMVFLYVSFIKSLDDTKYQELLKQNQPTYTNQVQRKKIIPKIIDIFKYIKLENLSIEQINYTNNKAKLIVLHKDKEKLLNFLALYGGETTIERIVFLEQRNLYSMEIKVEF